VTALAVQAVEPILDLGDARRYVGELARSLDPASRYVHELLDLIDSSTSVSELHRRLLGGRAHHHAKLAFESMSLEQKLMASVLTAETRAFRFSPEEERALLAEVTRPRRSPIRILSAPCSRGFEAISLAAYAVRTDVRFEILALDIQPSLVGRAREALFAPEFSSDRPAIERALDVGAGRIDLRAGDLFQVELGSGSFDLVVCRNLLGYFVPTKALELLKAVVRHVAPGGCLLLDEFCLDKTPALAAWLEARMLRVGEVALYRAREKAEVA
jgi:SAM-dependent methyltransferase